MSSGPDSPISLRTNALTILARIIAKDMLRKSVIGKAYHEIVPHTPEKKADDNIGDKSDERGPK
jgi:hypothetical protein